MRAVFALGGAVIPFLHGASAANPTIVNPVFTFASSPIPAAGTRKMEARFSPCSSHVFVVDKSGSFTAYSSVADELTFAFQFKNAVYEVGDHGPTGMLIHPSFPATPSIFFYYTADPTNKWKDSCTMAPDADGFTYCDTKQRLHRFDLTVTVAADGRCTAFALAGNQVLVEDWCSTSLSHGNGDIAWYDGANMILTSGDGAQPSQTDYGQRIGDVCFDPARKLPQGRFRPQRMDGFLQGKLLLFKATSLLKNAPLLLGTDYSIVARGLRQPYVNTVNPWTGDVLIGDVGSKIWEEVNVVTQAEMKDPSLWPLNFGWPCLEGRADQASPTKGDFKWLQNTCNATVDYSCDLCKDISPCANGVNSAGCSSSFRPPQFQFRDSIDRDDGTLCQASTHALVALTWMVGSDFSAEAAAVIPYALVGSDYGSGCIFYWDVDPATKRVLFENGASVLATNHEEGLYLTRGRDGFLYASKSALAEVNTLWRFGLIGSSQNVTVGPPVANLATSILDNVTGTYKIINCRSGCAFAANSTIKFDGSGSTTSPGVTIASYKVNFGDQTGSKKLATPTFVKTYAAAGAFKPVLIVVDSNGRNDTDSVNLNVRNTAVAISMTPATGAWSLGDVIQYQLTNLASSDIKKVTWDATVTHCRPNTCTGTIDCHTHTNGVDSGGTAFAGMLTPPGHAMPSSMTISAIVVPVSGTTFTVTAETTALVYTATVQAAVDGTGSGVVNVDGWPIDVVDVNTCFSPCQVPYMAGIASELSPSDIMFRGGNIYEFSQWEAVTPGVAAVATYPDGTVPIVADGMTLTANYALVTVTTDSVNKGPALVGATGYYGFIEVKWTVPAGGGYNWVLVQLIAADGTDRSAAALATDRKLVMGVPASAAMWTVRIAGYNSATAAQSLLGGQLSVASSGDSTKTCYAQSSPYGAAPFAVPGTVELEKFDKGGDGTAYHDLTAGNTGGASFRSGQDVDIQIGGSSGYAITQTDAGEWLEYTVTVGATADYTFTFYLASTMAGTKTLYLMVDATMCSPGDALLVLQQIGGTGGATTFVAYTAATPVSMTAGEHTLTLCVDSAGLVLDKMVIAAAAA